MAVQEIVRRIEVAAKKIEEANERKRVEVIVRRKVEEEIETEKEKKIEEIEIDHTQMILADVVALILPRILATERTGNELKIIKYSHSFSNDSINEIMSESLLSSNACPLELSCHLSSSLTFNRREDASTIRLNGNQRNWVYVN